MRLDQRTVVLGLLSLGAALWAGCHKQQQGAGAHGGPGAMPPPQVTIVPASQQEVVEWEEFTGRTAPVNFVEVRPRVSGHVEAVKFQSGQLVKKGDVLFQIDARWHKATLDQRNAELEAAKVKFANAEREMQRTEGLLKNNAISREEGDQRQARFEEARAMLVAAEAGVNTAKLDLDFTTVRSPIDGRVSREMVTAGNYVSGVAGNATLLTTVVSVDPVHVYADVDENSLLKFNRLAAAGKLQQTTDGKVPVQLQLADEEKFSHEGYIESFDNKLDPQTGSILLRAIFPNSDGRIVPGLFARIRLPASEKHPAVLIEETAIGTDQAQKFVLTLTSSNTVAYRPVKLGPQMNGKRLIRDGLQPGEQVVQNLVMARVRPGMPVQPQGVAATNAGATSSQVASAKSKDSASRETQPQ